VISLEQIVLKRSKRLLFANKKKQQNFFHLGRAGFNATGPEEQKFCKKAAAVLFPLKPMTL
jgi:hypothetical protein